MIKAIPNQIVRIQSPEAYKEEIRSKVKETFKNNIGTVVLFTALTLPMFFLAWPMALAVIFQDAKYEIDSSIANARIEFIKGLSNKLAENPNENPNTVFDTFQEENNRDFTQIFPKNVMQSDVIRLAKVFNKEGKALVLENNEVTALWKNLIQTERKITSYVSATNRFYQIIGAVDYSSDATSLNQALRDRHRAQLDLINWRDYCQPGTHLTNGQVLQKIRKDHGITLENLNLITECIVGPLTNNDLNAKREAHAEARRKVLDLLIQCPTQEKAKQFRDSLITNLWFENSPEGEQLKLFDLVLAVKFSQYFNSVNTHRDRIQESFELKKKDPALPFEGNTTWVTKEGKQIELPTWITRTEWGRRCPPIMIASNSSKKEKNAAEAAAKRSAKDVENTLTHANHFSSTEGNQQSTMNESLKTATAKALDLHYTPLSNFLDQIANETSMPETEKNMLKDQCLKALAQNYATILSHPVLDTLDKFPLNVLGAANDPRFSKQTHFLSTERNVFPVLFSFDPINKKVFIEFKSEFNFQNTQTGRQPPLIIITESKIAIDLDGKDFDPQCEAYSLRVEKKPTDFLAALPQIGEPSEFLNVNTTDTEED